MAELKGNWIYQSFYPLAAGATIAAPWTDPIPVNFNTYPTGKVTGTGTVIKGVYTVKFDFDGNITAGAPAGSPPKMTTGLTITPPSPVTPPGVNLTITASVIAGGAHPPGIYALTGFFPTGSSHVTGIVTAVDHDLRGQPNTTVGSFILIPV